jgi:hypothetical protein
MSLILRQLVRDYAEELTLGHLRKPSSLSHRSSFPYLAVDFFFRLTILNRTPGPPPRNFGFSGSRLHHGV